MSLELLPRADAAPARTTIDEEIACVRRELATRRRCHQSWEDAKKLTDGRARHEIRLMEGVLRRLLAAKARGWDALDGGLSPEPAP